MSGWRTWAVTAGALVTACGVALWVGGGGPMLLIAGAIVLLTALLEPIYGRATAAPRGGDWRPTDERFVDPESGNLVTVWFDPQTGERRYVADPAADRA